MTDTEHDATAQDHEAACLMCAVRALTEGDPAASWNPTEPGATISGVVLRQGEIPTGFGKVPFVDLWMGGTGRVRVLAYRGSLRHALAAAAAQVGDRLWLWYDGPEVIVGGRLNGQTIHRYSHNIQRGH